MEKKTVMFIFMMICSCFLMAEVLTKPPYIFVEDDSLEKNAGESSPLSANCMRCICEAMGCDRGVECRGAACGPFNLTLQYWQDTFNRNDVDEYIECAKHAWCSYRAVQRYMSRYLPQCVHVSEARPACESALALQLFGRERCSRALPAAARRQLLACRDARLWEWLAADAHSAA